ncbi:MAG TPA: SMC family ATPase [Jatrophihabitantaceae bacterium]|nr:SMC family ATPase [Jatrophihabitantaceae bacterium]
MRLHRLELSAIGPFAGPQLVDFDELTASGLFLLEGPTGAGKTTVLDAITFALYGPGERNGDGRLRSDFAPRDCAPSVALEFSVRGVRQRISRSPEFERPKRRGDGTTRQSAQAHLERHVNGRWVSRSSNKAEIADMLAEDLGLSRDQFTQVVLLPQGDFARFLQASDDDRRSLLTKLFGTQLYDRITDEFERQGQLATRDLEAAARRVRSCVAAAGEAAGLTPADREALCDLDPLARAQRLIELGGQLEADAAHAQTEAASAAECIVELREGAAAAAATVDGIERFAAALRLGAEHDRERHGHDAARARLAAARRAEAVRGMLRSLDEAEATVASATAEVSILDAAAAEQEMSDAVVDEAARAAADYLRAAAELQHLAEREQELTALRDECAAARLRADQAADRVAGLADRLAALPAEVAAAAERLDVLRAIAGTGAEARARVASVRAAADAASRLEALQPLHDAARAAGRRAIGSHQRAVDRHQAAVEARLRGMAAELAGRLAKGDPCPVCGATEHPQLSLPAPDAVTAADVEAAATRRAEAEAARSAAEAHLAALHTEVAAARAVAGAASPAELEHILAALVAQLDAADTASAELAELEPVHAALSAEQGELSRRHTEAVAVATAAAAAVHALSARHAELDSALTAARDGHPSVTERQQALQAAALRYDALAAAGRALCSATAQRDAVRSRAQQEAVDAGFDDLDDARTATLTATQLTVLQHDVERWEQQAEQLQAAIRAAEIAGIDTDRESLDEQRMRSRRLAAATARELAVGVERAEAAAALAVRATHARDRFVERCTDVADAAGDHERSATESEPVRYLSKLTRGMAGQRRVALTTFVLRRWFEQVVHAANVRLLVISSGRYELVRVDEGNGRSERSGLTLQVIDRHTGEARPARSLSGGETFYTSLALALGLADVVRAEAGGIELDTLFIDEGFGSLDAQTLDEVMAVIEDLRDRGRVVGIVSHVAELKELIHERVEVRRLADGSSTVRVVA